MLKTTPTHNYWLDSSQRFGRISRLLHWSMALAFIWLFAGMIGKTIFGLNPRESWFVGSHGSVGTLACLLLILRCLWVGVNWRHRPSYGQGFLAQAALFGHILLNFLMLVVPVLALMRQYGAGRDVELFGLITLIPSSEKREWMQIPANFTSEWVGFSTHGLLAWLLLAAIVGHVIMAVVHHRVLKDDTVYKMMGSRLY